MIVEHSELEVDGMDRSVVACVRVCASDGGDGMGRCSNSFVGI